MTRRSSTLRALGFVAVVLVLVGIGFAWQMQKHLTARSGEDALNHFAPHNAAIAMTLDLHPSSMEQVQVMQRIQSALKSEQLDTRMQSSLRKWTKDAPLVREVIPYLTGSGAIAAWEKLGAAGSGFQSGSPDVVLAIGISKDSEVVALLKKYADRTSNEDGQTLYYIHLSEGSPEVAVALSHHYLLLGEPPSLKQAFAVRSGKTKSLLSNPDFARLRKTLPSEANVLCYVSAEFIREAGKQSGQTDRATAELLQKAQPACTSITLRKDGVAFDSVIGGDAEYLKPIIESAPINPNASQRIPPNALAFCIVAQPSKYIEAMEKAIEAVGGETAESWNKGLADFERQSRIDLHEDIFPALTGHLILAAYPGPKPNSVDLLVLADTEHKANPAQLADQARDFITEQDHNVKFRSTERNNATFWTLPETWKVDSLGPNPSSTVHIPGERIAQVDNALLFATSTSLLENAVSTYRGKGKAANDTFRFPGGSKAVFVIHPARILDMARPHLEEYQSKRPAKDRIRAEELEDLFGKSPLVASAGYKDRYFTGSLFVPVRYETTVNFVRRTWDAIEDENKDQDAEELVFARDMRDSLLQR